LGRAKDGASTVLVSKNDGVELTKEMKVKAMAAK